MNSPVVLHPLLREMSLLAIPGSPTCSRTVFSGRSISLTAFGPGALTPVNLGRTSQGMAAIARLSGAREVCTARLSVAVSV